MDGVFLKVVNMSIAAGWLVLAVVLARFFLKKVPKFWRCLLWGMVGLRLVLPFSIESVFSLIPSTDTISPTPHSPLPQINTGFSAVDIPLNELIGHTTPVTPAAPTPSVDTSANVLSIAAIIWGVGMLTMLVYGIISYTRLRRRVKASLAIGGNLFLNDHISSPFILGILRPRIYIPSVMDDTTRAYVIAHETAHLKRLDHIWKPIGFALLTLHWFNPLVWVAYILLCRDIELACDERVVKDKDGDYTVAYSEALLSCSVPRRMVVACPLAFGEVGVKDRIRSALSYKKPTLWIILIAGLVTLAVAIGFLTDPTSVNVDEDLVPLINSHIASHYYSGSDQQTYCCIDWDVFESEEEEDKTTLYMWVMYREYRYDTEMKVIRTELAPAVMVFQKREDIYDLAKYWKPDSSVEPFEEIFPEDLRDEALAEETYRRSLSASCDAMAKEHIDTLSASSTTIPYELNAFIADTILEKSRTQNVPNRFSLERHRIMEVVEEDDTVTVYMWVMVYEYSMEITYSETHFPLAITVQQDGDGYKTIRYDAVAFDAHRDENAHRIFPMHLWPQVMNRSLYESELKIECGRAVTAHRNGTVDSGIDYTATSVAYASRIFSDLPSVEQFSPHRVTDAGILQEYVETRWQTLGTLVPISLDEENFDSRFLTDDWQGNHSAQKLREENAYAWELKRTGQNGQYMLYLLLQQQDGRYYLGTGIYRYLGNPDESLIQRLYEIKPTLDTGDPSLRDNPSFYATVEEVRENSLLVKQLDGENPKHTGPYIEVYTTLPKRYPLPEVQVNDTVRVVYDGEILETYPAQIHSPIAIFRIDKPNDDDYAGMATSAAYIYEDSTAHNPPFLVFSADGKTFIMAQADNLVNGICEHSGNRIILTSYDGAHRFTFIKQGDDLVFDAKNSTELSTPTSPVPDGAVFLRDPVFAND